jgi:hypothetical protein
VSSSESDSDVPTKVAQAKEAEGDDSDIEMVIPLLRCTHGAAFANSTQ